ncbi:MULTISPECIES: DUF2975 domain-containing protein [Cytobacillus]|uniref:DUF2975 domain-containing protein n=1 Tax=Cytobacillus stercorigallinarum TaxID=2762240 RepID=A0ABR8QTW7_9BACI|nr:DUF2975 domain-containing protein [Cytobacillus stercorigallinarum]MBD7938987.1 DUF2975 domain-containing protein [Cytobacillus stercorigallinarum]
MRQGKVLFLKVVIVILGLIVLGICIGLPFLAKETAELNPAYAYLKYPVLFGMYLSAIPFYFTLYQGYKLLRYISVNESFSEHSVAALRAIKYSCASISGIYLIGMIFLFTQDAIHPGVTLVGFVIIFVTTVLSIFSAVLQELLYNVLKIKSENDLTI